MKWLISHNTGLSVGLALALIAAAVSYGVLFQKVEGQGERLTRIEIMLDRLTADRLADSNR